MFHTAPQVSIIQASCKHYITLKSLNSHHFQQRFQLISILPLQFPAGGHSAHEGLHDVRSGVTGPPKHTSKLGLQMTCYPISEGKGCPQSTGPQAVCCGLPATLPEVRLPHHSILYTISILLPHQLITSAGICSPAASRPGSVHKGKAPPQRGPHHIAT